MRDFADEKPEVYAAMERMAIKSTEHGVEIRLPDQMCMDRHVPDFLRCLECWLRRCFGLPREGGRPWRLWCLDLARNNLSDGPACEIMEALRRMDVRVGRLWLAGNCLRTAAMQAVNEYVWNCPEAVLELDLADNEVVADPGGPTPGSDVVSALLRSFYNHSSYPHVLSSRAQGDGPKAAPLLLRLSGNFILEPKKLLREIQKKGGNDHVLISPDAEPYTPTGKEFLALFAPEFTAQRKVEEAPPGAFPPAAAPAAAPRHTPEERQANGCGSRSRSRGAAKERKRQGEGRDRDRRRRRDAAGAPGLQTADRGVPNSTGPAALPAKVGEAAVAPVVETSAVAAPGVPSPWPLPPEFGKEAQKELEAEVYKRLGNVEGMPSEEATRAMLAEFAVCMIVARKGPKELEQELQIFLAAESGGLVAWLAAHLKARYGNTDAAPLKTSGDNAFQ